MKRVQSHCSIRKKLTRLCSSIPERFWQECKSTATSRFTFALYNEIVKTRVPGAKLSALRVLCGYTYRYQRGWCSCANNDLFHFITSCDDFFVEARKDLHPKLQQYLALSRDQQKLTEIKNRDVLKLFINYLNKLYKISLRLIFNPTNHPLPL